MSWNGDDRQKDDRRDGWSAGYFFSLFLLELSALDFSSFFDPESLFELESLLDPDSPFEPESPLELESALDADSPFDEESPLEDEDEPAEDFLA